MENFLVPALRALLSQKQLSCGRCAGAGASACGRWARCAPMSLCWRVCTYVCTYVGTGTATQQFPAFCGIGGGGVWNLSNTKGVWLFCCYQGCFRGHPGTDVRQQRGLGECRCVPAVTHFVPTQVLKCTVPLPLSLRPPGDAVSVPLTSGPVSWHSHRGPAPAVISVPGSPVGPLSPHWAGLLAAWFAHVSTPACPGSCVGGPSGFPCGRPSARAQSVLGVHVRARVWGTGVERPGNTALFSEVVTPDDRPPAARAEPVTRGGSAQLLLRARLPRAQRRVWRAQAAQWPVSSASAPARAHGVRVRAFLRHLGSRGATTLAHFFLSFWLITCKF